MPYGYFDSDENVLSISAMNLITQAEHGEAYARYIFDKSMVARCLSRRRRWNCSNNLKRWKELKNETSTNRSHFPARS